MERDIQVDWELSALCSVCEDGVGEVVVIDSETIACEACGSFWGWDGDYLGTEEV